MSRLSRASPVTLATGPRTNTDTSTPRCGQRARHHEAVAAVVAPAAQHGDAALEQVLVVGFDGRHHLAAGVLHQHDRGRPRSSMVCRSASRICAVSRTRTRLGLRAPGFRLREYVSTGGQEQNRLRSPYGLSTRPTARPELAPAQHAARDRPPARANTGGSSVARHRFGRVRRVLQHVVGLVGAARPPRRRSPGGSGSSPRRSGPAPRGSRSRSARPSACPPPGNDTVGAWKP